MEILFYDKNILICVKPVGLDAEQEVPNELKKILPGEIYPIHRLDKNVGGVMVYARTKKAAAEFSQLVQSGELVKEYVAQVHGTPPESGVLEDLLFKDSRKNKVYVVNRQRAGVKAAKLSYRRLAAGQESVVLVRLYTGRSHQIRVQFSSRGFPLVGDHKYGSRSEKTEPMLFSCRLTFPYGGEMRCFAVRPEWFSGDFD
jgi:23S rRNA pseudouridine1911/1915/1917 synthase